MLVIGAVGDPLHPEDVGAASVVGATEARVTTWAGDRDVAATQVVMEVRFRGFPPRQTVVTLSETLDPGLGLMGNDFLADDVVTLDWSAGRLYLAPGSPEPRDIPAAPERSDA